MISIDREMFWQWDHGQRVKLHDVTAGTEVHFSNAEIKPNALVREAYEDGEGVYADVPNVLLQTAGTLSAYIYIEDGDEGHTEYRKLFIVRDREKPDDYVYTEDDVKTWEMLEERVKALEESGGGAADGLIRPLSTIGEIEGVQVEHVPDKDRVDLTVEMTADSMNSVFGGNAVYKNDYLNARQLQLMFRIPGAGRQFLWELFEDDLITVTNYPNKKFIMVSTNRMIFSFAYDENGQFVSETKTYQASVQQLDEVKATIPNSATVNDVDELVMQREDGDVVSELFKVRLPERGALKSYRYFSEIDWGTTLGSSFVVRDPYISKGDVYPDIPDGCEAPFICHTTLVRYTLTVIVSTADGRFFKTYLDLQSMKFSSVTEITQQGGGTPSEEVWEDIADITLEETVSALHITTDLNGNPFALKEFKAFVVQKPIPGNTSNTAFCMAINGEGWGGPSEMRFKGTPKETDATVYSYFHVKTVDGVMEKYRVNSSNDFSSLSESLVEAFGRNNYMTSLRFYVNKSTDSLKTTAMPCVKISIVGYTSNILAAGSRIQVRGIRA